MFDFLKKMFGKYSYREQVLIRMLKEVEILKGFTNDQLYEFSKRFQLKDYLPKTFLVKQGDKPDHIGLLETGDIKVFLDKEGERVQLGLVKEGDMFMEMSYFNNSEAMASLRTENGCLVWEISMKDFEELLNKYPNIKQDIDEVIAQRNRLNRSKIKEEGRDDYAIDMDGNDDFQIKLNL